MHVERGLIVGCSLCSGVREGGWVVRSSYADKAICDDCLMWLNLAFTKRMAEAERFLCTSSG